MSVDVNKPVENPRLKELFKQRANCPQDQQMPLLNQIAENIAISAFFLAVVDFGGAEIPTNPDGTSVIPKDTEISFPMLSLPDGSPVWPFFTDWEELRKWEPFKEGDVSTMIFTFDQIYGMTAERRTSIVINPFSDNFMLPFDMMEHMNKVKNSRTAEVQQQVVKEETKVLIGDPKEFPHQMADAISSHAETVSEIKAIWLKLLVKNGEQSFLLIVDAEGEQRRFFQGIADAAIPYLPKGMYIDMVPYDADFGRGAAEGEPFYRRK